ncbi:MAG TPA: hypothetical protein VN603_04595 [Candidatus Acidoferrales bacterium]|nr:hypothetical protein [Candidatus Acidoferrales bacterium]
MLLSAFEESFVPAEPFLLESLLPDAIEPDVSELLAVCWLPELEDLVEVPEPELHPLDGDPACGDPLC